MEISPASSPPVSYRIDRDDRLEWVNEGWLLFAEANGARIAAAVPCARARDLGLYRRPDRRTSVSRARAAAAGRGAAAYGSISAATRPPSGAWRRWTSPAIARSGALRGDAGTWSGRKSQHHASRWRRQTKSRWSASVPGASAWSCRRTRGSSRRTRSARSACSTLRRFRG